MKRTFPFAIAAGMIGRRMVPIADGVDEMKNDCTA
jgi:hypothetical protein